MVLSGCQTIPEPYTTYRGMPCHFHNAIVKTNNDTATLGSLRSRCCPNCSGYEGKRGQSIHVSRGTPVYAVADMTLIRARNKSALKNCKAMNSSQIKMGVGPGNCQETFDDLHLLFKDDLGNFIFYYHLMSENPFVPGFGKGNCKIPTYFQTERYKRKPINCGGFEKERVKKGELIGFSGSTGMDSWGEHFSFAIKVVNHPDFPNQTGWIVPTNSLPWENFPTKNKTIFLLPLKAPSLADKERMKSFEHKKK